MNLTESIKHVLKNHRKSLFTNFWKDDLRVIMAEIKNDILRVSHREPANFHNTRFKTSITIVVDTAQDTVTLLKAIPLRVKDGFTYFHEDILEELEKQEDPKQKALFSIKVCGALTANALSAFYGIRRTQTMTLKGVGKKGALTHYLLTQMALRVGQIFILRFLTEVEKGVTQPEDLKHVRYFKSLLSHPERLSESSELLPHDPQDRAFAIVDSLKDYILTGERMKKPIFEP